VSSGIGRKEETQVQGRENLEFTSEPAAASAASPSPARGQQPPPTPAPSSATSWAQLRPRAPGPPQERESGAMRKQNRLPSAQGLRQATLWTRARSSSISTSASVADSSDRESRAGPAAAQLLPNARPRSASAAATRQEKKEGGRRRQLLASTRSCEPRPAARPGGSSIQRRRRRQPQVKVLTRRTRLSARGS